MIYKTLQRKLKIEHHEPHYKPEMNTNALEGKAVPCPLVAFVMQLLQQTRWYVMNDVRTGLWLRQTEHNGGHLWHKYSVMVNKDTVATVKHSKWWLQLNQ